MLQPGILKDILGWSNVLLPLQRRAGCLWPVRSMHSGRGRVDQPVGSVFASAGAYGKESRLVETTKSGAAKQAPLMYYPEATQFL